MQVFLCHSKLDKQFVRDIYRILVQHGFSPWLDEYMILPGQDWEQEINKAVKFSEVILVFLSSHSVNKRGYIHKEISLALDVALEIPEDEIFIIPVCIDKCEVPTNLRKWQWVNCYDPEGINQLLRSLVEKNENNKRTILDDIDIPDLLRQQAD